MVHIYYVFHIIQSSGRYYYHPYFSDREKLRLREVKYISQ